MARPKKDAAPDLTQRTNLTVGTIERLTCPAGKQQAFLRDAEAPGLRVRVTAAGAKSFVFEAKLNRQTIRRTIGDVRAWSIEAARAEARRLAVVLDNGADPRELERQQKAAAEARKAAQAAMQAAQAEAERLAALPASDAWSAYLEDRRPFWGERHHADHERLALPGGKKTNRGTKGRGVTLAGPLASLLALKLRELDEDMVEAWAKREAQTRPAQARLALRLLKAFLSWCATHQEFASALRAGNPAKSRRAREALGEANSKDDVLLREQLPAWFTAVRALPNPTQSAYLQALLLCGCRPGEMLELRWEDMGTQWRSLTIRDKVEGERTIPLTPYVHHLLAALPRRNEWVFGTMRKSESGRMAYPSELHRKACAAVGLDGLTLHGLRRSFSSLTEWLEIPAGVVAQIQGHKPSATAEKHYKRRPLDLLRVHHERIEAWILEQAGVPFDASQAAPGALRVVS